MHANSASLSWTLSRIFPTIIIQITDKILHTFM